VEVEAIAMRMTTSLMDPERNQHRNGTVPMAPPPGKGLRRSSRRLASVVVLILVGMLASGGGVYLWQNAQVRDQRAVIAAALEQRNAARGDVAALIARLTDVQTKLAASRSAARKGLAKLQARFDAMVGPTLANGKYVGMIKAIGSDQRPPRLLFDVEQLFAGAAADRAATEDGAMPPGETHIPNDIYIRNANPQWRMIPMDPASKVALVSYPFGQIDGPRIVSLEVFSSLYSSGRGFLSSFPYWITVRKGTIVAIDQQFVP
jgi:hypothetical protein